MTTQAFARWITWAMLSANVLSLVVHATQRQYAGVVLTTVVIVLLASWLSVLDGLQGYADAKAGKAIADRAISEVTLKAVEEAMRRGQYRVDVVGDRASVN